MAQIDEYCVLPHAVSSQALKSASYPSISQPQTTLRQEGIVIPSKRPSPRRLPTEEHSRDFDCEDSDPENGHSSTVSEDDSRSGDDNSPPLEIEPQIQDLQDSQEALEVDGISSEQQSHLCKPIPACLLRAGRTVVRGWCGAAREPYIH